MKNFFTAIVMNQINFHFSFSLTAHSESQNNFHRCPSSFTLNVHFVLRAACALEP